MNRTVRQILFSILLALSVSFTQPLPERPYILLISFDGFRADYLDWVETPNFDRLAQRGVKAKGLKPVFITKTFPNHYSLATGMYAENHGLIANYFYDEQLDLTYKISDRTVVADARFYKGEPIWVTAEKQGVKTASYFWVGDEAPIGGVWPSIWKEYEHNFPFEARIDSIAAWFQLPEIRRPHLALLYFHEPDAAGHEYGPEAQATKDVITALDALLGKLLSTMEKLPIYPLLNIIIVSDHGMASISPDRTINLADYVNLEGVIQEGTGPTTFLYGCSTYRLTAIYRKLLKVPHLEVYLKRNIPDRWHYRNNYRIKDLLVVADEGWSIVDYTEPNPDSWSKGDHGFDNALRSMQAIFLADGPAFKDGYEREAIENVNVYPLMAYILGLIPNPDIDGNLEDVADLLRE